MPENSPQSQPQPEQDKYGVEYLYTSPRHTRATYEALYREQAPAYDPARRIKRWFFTNILKGSVDPANELVGVPVWDPTTNQVREIVMTKADVASINLPGTVVYPKYINSENSPAVLLSSNGTAQPLNGFVLCSEMTLRHVVEELLSQLGLTPGSATITPAPEPWPWKVVWGVETRRQLNVSLPLGEGITLDGASLLRTRFEKGVGVPGTWTNTGTGVAFVATVPSDGAQDLRPEIPMPARELYPGERIGLGFGGLPMVVNDEDGDSSGPGTGILTLAQDRMLRRIDGRVESILNGMVR